MQALLGHNDLMIAFIRSMLVPLTSIYIPSFQFCINFGHFPDVSCLKNNVYPVLRCKCNLCEQLTVVVALTWGWLLSWSLALKSMGCCWRTVGG